MNGAQIPTFDPARQRPVMPSSMELVVNAIDIPVEFEIGGVPGSPAMRFVLPPGGQAMLPATYCLPIPGANPRVPRPSVLAMVASVEPYPNGPQIQAVVPMDQAAATAKKWREAKHNAPKTNLVMLQDTNGNTVPLSIPKAIASPPPARRREEDDDEDQEDNEIEPPPPGVSDIRDESPAPAPVAAAPASKPKAQQAKGKAATQAKPKAAAPAATPGPKTISDGGE